MLQAYFLNEHGNIHTKVTLEVTDTNKINIASSQVVFKWSSFQMDARSKSSTLVVNSHVNSQLFQATPDVDHPPFIHATDSVSYTHLTLPTIYSV